MKKIAEIGKQTKEKKGENMRKIMKKQDGIKKKGIQRKAPQLKEEKK